MQESTLRRRVSKRHVLLKQAGAALLLLTTHCASQPNGEQPSRVDATEQIVYRGRPMTASRVGDQLLIEGDIVVMPDDLDPPRAPASDPSTDDSVAVLEQAVRRQGAQYRWTRDANGLVPIPFVFANGDVDGDGDIDTLSPLEQSQITAAMNDWMREVPSLRFIARTTETDFIRFQLEATCSSPVGHHSGIADIKLSAGCMSTFSVHHEIGHTLGIFHEQTRKDRNSFVTINWANIIGCPGTATSPADCGNAKCAANPPGCGCTANSVADGSCDMSYNFTFDNARADLYDYDFDSVMHYSALAFSKGGPTIVAPQPIGQRDHLSASDILGIQSMYPTLRMQEVFFRDTGSQTLCTLEGHSQDIAVGYTVTPGALPAAAVSAGNLQTDALAENTYNVTSCTAKSAFWRENYDYPNATVTINLANVPPNELETSSRGQTTVSVLSRGLIPVIFGR